MKLNLKRVNNFLLVRIERIKQNRKMFNFYRQLINKNDLCFDVGANIGNRTDIFLKLGAKVITIDPQKVCFETLSKKYSNNKNVVLINKALGEKEGQAEMMIGESSTLSTISKDWIDRVKISGRFGDTKWDNGYIVPVTTLDHLINDFGYPAFCKIDVEGFEYEVLNGLSKPISLISFEFAPEFIHKTISCIDHLLSIGNYKFNYSLGESMEFENPQYISGSDISKILRNIKDETVFGDVYARLEIKI